MNRNPLTKAQNDADWLGYVLVSLVGIALAIVIALTMACSGNYNLMYRTL